MSYKRTLVFLVAFLALAAFFYLYEIRGGETRREVEQKAKLLLSFKPEDVTMLALRRRAELIIVEKDDGEWKIVEPVSAPAERQTIMQILDALAELKYERNIGERTDLESFGLSEPEVAVEIKGSQEEIGKLLLGAHTPDGGNFYIRKAGEQQVFTATKSAKDKIDRSLYDMRDKTLFDFSAPDVKTLTISRNGQALAFVNRPKGEWTMTSPEEHSAGTGRITALLDSIRYARIKKFVEEHASDLGDYGLAPPSARVELGLDEGTRVLSFGKESASDSRGIYASRNSKPQVLELDPEMFDKLSTDVDDWRDRRLVKLERTDVARLQIHSPAGEITVERSAEDSDEWKLTEPEPAIADTDRVEDLLSGLQDASVIRFLKGADLDAAERIIEKPVLRLVAWEKESEAPLTLLLSKSGATPEVYARTEQDGEIFAVDEGLLKELTIGPDEIKDKSVLRFDKADIVKIEIAKGEKSFVMKRKDVTWKMPDSLQMEPFEMDQLLWNLRELEYNAIGPKEKDDASYGFDFPTLTVRLWSAEGGSGMRLVIGKRTPEQDSYHVLGNDDTQVMEVNDALLTPWLDKF